MGCAYPISPNCFSWIPVTIKQGTLAAKITEAGSVFTNFQNLNVFQDGLGRWHAVLAIGVRKPTETAHWTVLVYATPTTYTPRDKYPLSWTADTVLSGSFDENVAGYYDGKYYLEDGRLYLRICSSPPLDGV